MSRAAPSSVELAVVERLDREIAAFVHEDPQDRRRRLTDEPPVSGPLHGWAVGVKDLYRVNGLPTRAGSDLDARLFAGDESVVVGGLRAAGATILGKTAMDEFAYCEPPPTKNPRDRRRTPGGSSGGSAAAVAAGMCALAVGSQTLQSTIVPAAYCGVVGYKPSFDRLTFDGVPLAPSFDTIGLLASTMPVLQTAAKHLMPHWRSTDRSNPPVLGIPKRWGLRRLHAEGWDAFDRHVQILVNAGFEVRYAEPPWKADLDYWATAIRDLLHGEMARIHSEWYARYADRYRRRTREAVVRGQDVSDRRIDECRTARESFIARLNQTTSDTQVDCWICPAAGSVAPLGYNHTGDSWLTCFWSYAGWPAITLPIFDGAGGLPHGLQCIAPYGQDEELLDAAGLLSAVLANHRG